MNNEKNIDPAYDEVSLTDLAKILVRRKYTVYIVFTLIVMLGVIAAFILQEKYSYSTTIEIGQKVENGKVVLIEEPDTLLAKIQETYIPLALQDFYKRKPGVDKIYELEVKIPKKSQIIILTTKGTAKEKDTLTLISDKVVKSVLVDHDRLVKVIKKNYELESSIIHNEILSDEQQASIYEADLKRLDKNTELVKKQIIEINKLINNGIENRKKAANSVRSESSAMTLLMIDNEIQQNRNRLDRLEEKVVVEFNNKKDVVNKKLSDTLRRIAEKKEALALKKLELENLRDTRALVIGMQSLKPVNLSKKLILTLAIFIGFFVAFFAAFIHEFFVNMRSELTEK
jgi:hypothetical protein